MTNIPNKRFFRIDEAAEILGERIQYVRIMMRRGIIKYQKRGPRNTKISREEIEKILQKRP
jgi:hypothetical protein